jgi:DNA-binding ferritin-like protein
MLQDILVIMISLRDFYHTSHVTCKNSVYYGDHLLLERLYTACDDHVDSIMEKIVGIGLGEQTIHLPTIYKKVFERIKNLPYSSKENSEYFSAAYTLEESLKNICELMNKDDVTSVGVKNFIGDIADKSETRCYLIKQRLAK